MMIDTTQQLDDKQPACIQQNHWADKYLLETFSSMVEAAYQYASPREAWENWGSASGMIWLLRCLNYISYKKTDLYLCLCDMAEHILPVFKKYFLDDDCLEKMIKSTRAMAKSDEQDTDYADKLFAVEQDSDRLRRICVYPTYSGVAGIQHYVCGLARRIKIDKSTCPKIQIAHYTTISFSEVPDGLLNVVKLSHEPRIVKGAKRSRPRKSEIDAAVVAAADERQWQCDCVRKYFPGDLFDFEEKYDD
jgi:hypothetical protein